MNVNFKKLSKMVERYTKDDKARDTGDVERVAKLRKKLLSINNVLTRIGLHTVHPLVAAFEMDKKERVEFYHLCNVCYRRLYDLIKSMGKLKIMHSEVEVCDEVNRISVECVNKMSEMTKCMICLIDKNGLQIRSDARLKSEEPDLPSTGFYNAVRNSLDAELDLISTEKGKKEFRAEEHEYQEGKPKRDIGSNLLEKPKEEKEFSFEEDMSGLLEECGRFMDEERAKDLERNRDSDDHSSTPVNEEECPPSQIVGK